MPVGRSGRGRLVRLDDAAGLVEGEHRSLDVVGEVALVERQFLRDEGGDGADAARIREVGLVERELLRLRRSGQFVGDPPVGGVGELRDDALEHLRPALVPGRALPERQQKRSGTGTRRRFAGEVLEQSLNGLPPIGGADGLGQRDRLAPQPLHAPAVPGDGLTGQPVLELGQRKSSWCPIVALPGLDEVVDQDPGGARHSKPLGPQRVGNGRVERCAWPDADFKTGQTDRPPGAVGHHEEPASSDAAVLGRGAISYERAGQQPSQDAPPVREDDLVRGTLQVRRIEPGGDPPDPAVPHCLSESVARSDVVEEDGAWARGPVDRWSWCHHSTISACNDPNSAFGHDKGIRHP